MKTLRVIQTSSGGKNVGFRSLNEIMNVLGEMRIELDGVDERIGVLELSAITVEIDNKAPRKATKNAPGVVVLSAPDAKSIDKNFKIVDDLDEKIKSLDSMLAQLAYQFKGAREHADVVREVRALRKDVEDRIKKAYAAINKIAKGNVSAAFKTFAAEVAEILFDKLDGAYEKSSQRLFVDTELEGTVRFTHYIKLENFEDDSGHNYKEYHIALTHLHDADGDHFHVNSTPRFRVPGRFNIGIEVYSAEAACDVLENILLSEGFKTVLSDNSIPLGKRDVPEDKFKHIAQKLTVDDDSLTFTIRKEVAFKSAINELFLLVKGLVDGKVPDTDIKYTVEGQKVRFFLTNSKNFKLNRSQLRLLQTQMGLSDDDTKRIMQEIL